MTQVFLNYRSADKDFGVPMIDAALSSRFGSDAVFLASKSVTLGGAWQTEMFDAVERSVALLVIMGRNWLNSVDQNGNRRIDQPDDFVRREILLAHELDKRIIPVRLDTPRLTSNQLPAELRWLVERQDIEIRFRAAKLDVDRLADKLKVLIPELREHSPTERRTPGTNVNHGTVNGILQQVDTLYAGDFHAGSSIHYHGGDEHGR